LTDRYFRRVFVVETLSLEIAHSRVMILTDHDITFTSFLVPSSRLRTPILPHLHLVRSYSSFGTLAK